MRLLDRYLLRELLVPLGYCLSGFLIFWISFDLISELDEFQKKHLTVLDLAQYYLVKSPDLLVVVMPVALLLALLYSLTHHARHNEITAIRCAGVNLWRLSLPYLAVGLFFSAALFAINELWLPDSGDLTAQILERRQPRSTNNIAGKFHYNLTFHNARDHRFWRIRAYNLTTGEMDHPDIVWEKSNGFSLELSAERGIWTTGCWTFYNVQGFQRSAPPESKSLPLLAKELALIELNETPEQIKSEIKISNLNSASAAQRIQLSLADILAYQRLHPHLEAGTRAMLETQFQGRLAAPWTCLVVVLIALPFATLTGRRNVFVGVASSIFICFGYFVLLKLGLALGTGNYAPPWIAAWLPNLLFGGGGLVLAHRLQ